MASAFHTPDRAALAGGAAAARVAPGAPVRRNSLPSASFFTMQPLTDSAADKPFRAARNLANLFQGMSVEQQAMPGPTYEMDTMIRADGSQRPFYEQQPQPAAPVRTNAVVMRKALMESNVAGVEAEYIQFDAANLTPDNVPIDLIKAVQLYDSKHHRHSGDPGHQACVVKLQAREGKYASFGCRAMCVIITVTTL